VLPWARRVRAAALLAAMADPDCWFDAVVTGECERAFYGSQYALMVPLFEHYGIQLWMPEAGGQVDFCGEGQEAAVLALGSSPSGKSPAPGSGSAPRWPPRPTTQREQPTSNQVPAASL
jgi:hypothetical protein